GGDGGDGGSILVVADPGLSTLLDFKYRRHYAADRGEDGRNKDQYGARGEDLLLRVPVGTVVYAEGARDVQEAGDEDSSDDSEDTSDDASDDARDDSEDEAGPDEDRVG